MKNIERFIQIAQTPVAYNETAKKEFLRLGKQVAVNLAQQLGLDKKDYDVRVNKAGIAVSGEVTLHTDRRYIQLGQFCGANDRGFLVRTCKGRKDYVGGQNYYVKWESLRDMGNVCEFVLNLS